jgi:hypothetical protein
MKKCGLALVGLMMFSTLSAQTLAETFQQKKTQKQYLLKQILLLEVLAKHAAEGYQLVAEGTRVVRNIKEGEFNLHDAFLGGFSKVNPAVRKSVSVTETIRLHGLVISICGTLKKASEDHIRAVAENAIQKSWEATDELVQLTTGDQLVLSDYERIKRCDEVYRRERSLYQFLRKFSSDYKIYLQQKKRL